jgi:adenylosuccinate lyase
MHGRQCYHIIYTSEIGIIPPETAQYLTEETKEKLLSITASEVYKTERVVTKHDVRAWVHEAKKLVHPSLAAWIHVPLTSYDALDTGRIYQFVQAHNKVVKPALHELIALLVAQVRKYAKVLQIGRTHNQHALPITVGFWLATILYRLLYNCREMDQNAEKLVGKISGAVGAYNAQRGLGISHACELLSTESFEDRVLAKLGLKASPISTQILPPEPLAYYFFSGYLTSATLAQFGRDCRNLMRNEIAELAEEFDKNQVGSSTMAHKRNPITFENIEGMALRNKGELLKVIDTLISDLQRDLVGSCVSRDFPIMIINLMVQVGALLRKNQGRSFLERITIDSDACMENFAMSSDLILSEPLYIALQMAGYQGDAHDLVNHVLVPIAQQKKCSLTTAVLKRVDNDEALSTAWYDVPQEIRDLLRSPEKYNGDAEQKALQIAQLAEDYVNV